MDNLDTLPITYLTGDDVARRLDFAPHEAANSPDLLADYFSLTDVALRKRMETPRGIYLAESRNVIDRALGAGHVPRSVMLEEKWLPKMSDTLRRCVNAAKQAGGSCPIFVSTAPVIESVTGYRVHRGALAAMHRPNLPAVDDILRTAKRIAVLEDIVDHTNVGAIFRSAAGLGVDAVLVTPRCADPLYRRSIRVSMGTVFQVPWTRMETWPPTTELHRHGFHCAAMALGDRCQTLDAFEASTLVANPDSRIAFILGSEGPGLAKATLDACDTLVTIPMGNGVDSLNVAAASAVVFWAIRHRQPQ